MRALAGAALACAAVLALSGQAAAQIKYGSIPP